ncbi:head-tail connector protein [Aureimonas altamirensis]|uniref:head-tail connector protein n=1 Tax=Aureimonas altamirensis TaxID=370622 RepID=UPI00301620CB
MNLASLDETKRALIIDHDDDDAILDLMISAASSSIKSYTGIATFDVVPDDIKIATILLTSYLYDPAKRDERFDGNTLPFAVASMLLPYRTPVVG